MIPFTKWFIGVLFDCYLKALHSVIKNDCQKKHLPSAAACSSVQQRAEGVLAKWSSANE